MTTSENTASKPQPVMVNSSVKGLHVLRGLKDELDGGRQFILVEFITAEAVDDAPLTGERSSSQSDGRPIIIS